MKQNDISVESYSHIIFKKSVPIGSDLNWSCLQENMDKDF